MSWWTRLWPPWRPGDAQPAPQPAAPEASPAREHIPELHDLRGAAGRERLRMELLERDLAHTRAARLARLEAEAQLHGREGRHGQ